MSKLLIKLNQQKTHVFPLKSSETRIGRGENCHLILQNVSVSREHARIVIGSQNVTIEDLDSQNGFLVNGKKTGQTVLRSGDEVQLGNFTLIYLTEVPANKFYRGRCVAYMPRYEPGLMTDEILEESTFVMTLAQLEKLQKLHQLVDSARLIREPDVGKFWHPEEKGLTFGRGGQVWVAGWLTWGVVANIIWDGQQHSVHAIASWRAAVTVNKQPVEHRALKHGDRISIGGSRFRYDAGRSPAKEIRDTLAR
ncbi:MAG: FHA domain-containing protein [Myxococcales bacterium]|nr:FHA domain-containing protein [Myxococcales bacterium]